MDNTFLILGGVGAAIGLSEPEAAWLGLYDLANPTLFMISAP